MPEHLLPLIKASFLCTAKVARKELLAIVRNRIKNSHMRLDPTYENYVKVLDIFVGKAKGNPLKNYLQI